MKDSFAWDTYYRKEIRETLPIDFCRSKKLDLVTIFKCFYNIQNDEESEMGGLKNQQALLFPPSVAAACCCCLHSIKCLHSQDLCTYFISVLLSSSAVILSHSPLYGYLGS